MGDSVREPVRCLYLIAVFSQFFYISRVCQSGFGFGHVFFVILGLEPHLDTGEHDKTCEGSQHRSSGNSKNFYGIVTIGVLIEGKTSGNQCQYEEKQGPFYIKLGVVAAGVKTVYGYLAESPVQVFAPAGLALPDGAAVHPGVAGFAVLGLAFGAGPFGIAYRHIKSFVVERKIKIKGKFDILCHNDDTIFEGGLQKVI